ncbi:MAG: hypothetical protein AB7U05_18520 [Mangrovibacterium sp.]
MEENSTLLYDIDDFSNFAFLHAYHLLIIISIAVGFVSDSLVVMIQGLVRFTNLIFPAFDVGRAGLLCMRPCGLKQEPCCLISLNPSDSRQSGHDRFHSWLTNSVSFPSPKLSWAHAARLKSKF